MIPIQVGSSLAYCRVECILSELPGEFVRSGKHEVPHLHLVLSGK